MKKTYTPQAQISNPALKQFDKLVGEWKTIGTHPLLPGKILNGHASFKWIEGGAFLSWHSVLHEKHFPGGIAIFGSDDAMAEFFMLYFDDRTVSRKYEVSFHDNVLKWWRNAPEFSQRYTWRLTDNDNTIIGKGELCQDGTNWGRDLEQTFTRVK
ncbi:MAG: hypothetical protein ABIR66_09935 [Saprospiraceae bacterium]